MRALVLAVLSLTLALALAAPAAAQIAPAPFPNEDCYGPAGDPEPGSAEWEERDRRNMICAALRNRDQLASPAYGYQHHISFPGLHLNALVPALLADWTTTDGGARGVFAGLLALAVVMAVRGELAVRGRPGLTSGPTAGFVDHVGFTLIALADGFAVVTAIRAGLPGWAVGVVAVGIVGIGHLSHVAAKARLVRAHLTAAAAA